MQSYAADHETVYDPIRCFPRFSSNVHTQSHYLFAGNANYHYDYADNGDVLVYITPNVPGYYPVYAVAYYDDETDGETYSVSSDFFMLKVLDQNGNDPEPQQLAVEIFSIPSVTVGETLQINWTISGYYMPYSHTIQVLRGSTVLDSWNYEDTDRDTYTFTEAGTYHVQVIVSDGLGRSVTGDKEIRVIQPKSLVLNSLTLQYATTPSTGVIQTGGIHWILDYEGGYGTKRTEIYLVNTASGDQMAIEEEGFCPSFVKYGVENGTYYLRMNVIDDEGEHWIDSNQLTLSTNPDWDFYLPSGTKTIEQSAFEKTKVNYVRVNNGCLSIGESAFNNTSLKAIYLPSSVTSIGNNAIPANTVIYTPSGSWAENWAIKNHFNVMNN